MIPLVGFETELTYLRNCSRRRRSARWSRPGKQIAYQFGTMIELPRAALTAGEIAEDGGVLLLRHERPDTDDARMQPRRRGGQVPRQVPGDGHADRQPIRDDRPGGRRFADETGDRAGQQTRPQPEARASAASTAASRGRWSSFTHRARLRELLALPRPDRAARSGAGGAAGRAAGTRTLGPGSGCSQPTSRARGWALRAICGFMPTR